jgi:ATP-dependent DNA helicase RecQ
VQLLSVSTPDIGTLVTTINIGTEKEKMEAIRLLLDAGKIKTDGEKYYL